MAQNWRSCVSVLQHRDWMEISEKQATGNRRRPGCAIPIEGSHSPKFPKTPTLTKVSSNRTDKWHLVAASVPLGHVAVHTMDASAIAFGIEIEAHRREISSCCKPDACGGLTRLFSAQWGIYLLQEDCL